MTSFVGFPQDSYDFSANEVGQALAGLVPRGVDGLPKRGWLKGPSVAAVAAAWKVQVGRGVYVDHAAGAVSLSGVSDVEQLDIEPATNIPAGQSRIDRVVFDPASGVLSVVQGVDAVSPVAPSIGALVPVSRVLVQSGDGMVVGSRVSPDFVIVGPDRFSVYAAPGYAVAASTTCEVEDGVARLRGRITASDGTILSNTWLATVQDGARPAEVTPRPAVVSMGGNAAAAFMEVRANGGIYVWGPAPGNRNLDFDITYRVA